MTAPQRVADDVHVVVVGRAVGRRAVAEVRVLDQPDLLEHVEGAVDGGEVDAVDGLRQFVRGAVAQPPHGGVDLLALRCHPQTAAAQPGRQLVGHRSEW